MFKELATLLYLTRFAFAAPSPYQYNAFTTVSSTPPPGFVIKQNLNGDSGPKFNVGYKIQDAPSNKVKKEYGNSEYLFPPESSKRPQTFTPDFSYEDYSTTPGTNVLSFPYTGQLKPNSLPASFFTGGKPFPPTASSKVFVHHHDKPHVIHDLVGHVITDVAGHKLKHYGEALESGALTEPIIHKLSFAKAALLQLLAIIGPLSAIKTIHVVAKASDPHHHDHHEPEPFEGVPPGFSEHIDPFPPAPHPHHTSTLSAIIFNFIASLSKFNTEAKLHLIPNLLKILGSSSSSSAHASAHH